MAQLSAIITTSDSDFRSTITTLLRSSGVSIGIIDEKHAGGTWPDLAVVDMRNGTLASVEAIERLRASWPSTSIFAVAASSEPDQILRAMRAGANEYLAWPIGEPGASLKDSFQTALKRTSDRHRPAKRCRAVRRHAVVFRRQRRRGHDDAGRQHRDRHRAAVEAADPHHRSAPVRR
jgi:CheY-like chemotaxis protein